MLMKSDQGTNEWRGFSGTVWQRCIDVRDFIVSDTTPYAGGPEFLARPTKRTFAV